MRNYKSQQRREKSVSNPRQMEYSPSLLEKALGFVRALGLEDIPEGVRSVLDYAIRTGNINQKQIDLAQLRYHQEYEQNLCERLFS